MKIVHCQKVSLLVQIHGYFRRIYNGVIRA